MSPAASSSALLTLPNLLSLSRLPLGGVFWIALGSAARATPARAAAALGVMGLAAVTDMLDGYVARRRGADLVGAGSWLDPFCDKLFVGAVLGALHVQRGVSLGLLALIVTRELLQLPMALVYRVVPTLHHWLQYDFRASALGKAATCAQFLAIAALVVGVADPTARALAFLAFALGVTALADYVRRAIRIGQQRLAGAPPPGGGAR
jgi:phosphatidylglycerophosphate synthase